MEPIEVEEIIGCFHVPLRFDDRTFTTFDRSVGKAAGLAYAATWQLVNGHLDSLLLSGPPGCGKSHLAAAAAHQLADPLQRALAEAEIEYQRARAALDAFRSARKPWAEMTHVEQKASNDENRRLEGAVSTTYPVVARAQRALDRGCPLWLNVSSFLGKLRRSYSSGEADDSDTTAAMETRRLLILDDLGAERGTDWAIERVFEIVSVRYDELKPTLITSNLTARQLTAAGYGRLVSRMGEGGAVIEMASAGDYRLRLRRSVAS